MKIFWNLLSFLFLMSIFLGCSGDSSEPYSPKTILIGAIVPLTGSSASSGQDIRDGIELAVSVINKRHDLSMPLAGGEGLPGLKNAKIQIVFKDSETDEKRAAHLVEELVKQSKVAAILGCYNSTVTATASEAAEIYQIPFVNADSTSPILIQRGLKWFFRTTPDDEMFAQNFFDFFSDLSRESKISIPRRLVLVYENRLWGTSVSRAEKRLATKNDYEIVGDIPYDARDDRFDQELSQIKATMPAIILQASYAKDAVLLMRGYRSLGIHPAAILAMNAGFISPLFLKELESDADYVLSREVWATDIQGSKPLAGAVNRMFNKRFNRDLSGNSARAFTGLIVLAEAINRAGAIEAEQIRRSLIESDISGDQIIMPWEGVRFDPNTGQNTLGRGIIVQVQEGQYRTVWPLDLASRPVVWPLPPWSEKKGQN